METPQSPTMNSSIRAQIRINFIPVGSLAGQKATPSGDLPNPDIR
jgi:hypothetical protein